MKTNVQILLALLFISFSSLYSQNLAVTAPTLPASSQETSKAVLFDQPVEGTSGIITCFTTPTSGTFSADDFSLAANSEIGKITVYGFYSSQVHLDSMSGIDLYIYNDVSGVPEADPVITGTGLLEVVDLSPTSPNLTIEIDPSTPTLVNFIFDITAILGGTPLSITAGTYWLVVAPRQSSVNTRWNWFQSTDGTLSEAHLTDPAGNFGVGQVWSSFTGLGLDFSSLAFKIEDATPPVGISEAVLENVNILPNPTLDNITVTVPNSAIVTSLELYDTVGKRVSVTTNSKNIDLSGLSAGVYLLKINSNEGSITKRVVKL